MFGSAIIVFRETLEAALIIGIIAAASLANPLWNTARLLDNTSVVGRFLHTLIGYEAMPSGIQVVIYTATLALVLAGMWIFRVRPPSHVIA